MNCYINIGLLKLTTINSDDQTMTAVDCHTEIDIPKGISHRV